MIKATFPKMGIEWRLSWTCSILFPVMCSLFLVATHLPEATSLKCYCDPKECDFIRSEDCPGQGLIIKDPCKCCDVCAKTEGEPCGGPGDFSGTCEPSLECVSKFPVTDPGVCTDFHWFRHPGSTRSKGRRRGDGAGDVCPESERMDMAAGCVIANKRCKCFHKSYRCSNDLHHTWDFHNLSECQLNLKTLLKVEMEFDEDFKVAANLYDMKRRRRKRAAEFQGSIAEKEFSSSGNEENNVDVAR